MKKLASLLMALLLCLCFVGCGEEKEDPKEVEQKEVESLAKGILLESDQIEQNTELPSKAGSIYKITWTLEENDRCELQENDGIYTIVILENSNWSAPLKLVATVHGTLEGVQATKEFEIYARKKVAEQVTIAEFLDNSKDTKVKNGDTAQVSGTVYFTCPGGFWVIDETNTHLYVYGSYTVKAGNEVTVVGQKDLYYSMVEMKNAATTVTNAKEGFDLTTITEEGSVELLNDYMPKDSNEKVDPANFGKIFTIEGTIVTNDLGGTYTYALESHITGEKVALYDSQFADGDKDNLAAKFGKYVKFTCMYWDMYSDGFIRIIPIGAIEEKAMPELTNEQKVMKAEAVINRINKEFAVSTTLPTDVEGVTISWVSSNPEVLREDGTILQQTEEKVEVKLTATITLGDLTKTVEITVKVMPLEEKTVLEATQVALEGTERIIKVKGQIIGLDTSSKKFFYIADNTGVSFVRSQLDSVAPEGVTLEVGDSVELVVKTTVYYNNNKEITPQLSVIKCDKLEEKIAVIEAETVTFEDLKKITNGTSIEETEKTQISKNALYGKLVKLECYVQVRTSGNYTNAYLVISNDTSEAINVAYYQHTSLYQDEVKALDGKKVVIVCPVYGYSASYGWRLGTYISLDVVE